MTAPPPMRSTVPRSGKQTPTTRSKPPTFMVQQVQPSRLVQFRPRTSAIGSGRDLDRELLGRDADPLRTRGYCLLQSPAQRALVQLPDLPVDRDGHDDRDLPRAVRDAREQASALVDLEPRWTLSQCEVWGLDVPVVHRFSSADHARPEVSKRADGGERVAVFRSHFGDGDGPRTKDRPGRFGEIRRPAPLP